MGTINKVAGGFLEFFGTKTQGRNPADMSQFVQPIVDIGKFIAGSYSTKSITLLCTAPAAGKIIWLVPGDSRVPDGKVWILTGYCLEGITTNAGDSITVKPVIYSQDGAGNGLLWRAPIAGPTYTVSGAAGRRVFSLDISDPWYLPAGYSLQAYVESVSIVTAVTVTGTAQVLELLA